MGHCFTRLFNYYNKSKKYVVTSKFQLKPTTKRQLTKLTDNFYCLKRKKERWDKSELELLNALVDYKIFSPIPSLFCREAIFGSYNPTTKQSDYCPHMILFNYDTSDGNKRSLRGIASITLDIENSQKYMKLNLVGNISTKSKPVLKSKKRNNIQTKSGSDIMNYLKEKALKLKLKYIKLYSMETVIGFYWKMGWRFKKHNKTNKYYEEKIIKLNEINKIKDNDIERDKLLTKYFDRFLPGYYNDILLSEDNRWDTDHTDYDITTTLRRQRWELRYHGYLMYWYC